MVLGAMLALVSPPGSAVAFFSGGLFLDVQVESPARLVARGAAVDVPLEITCNAAGTAFLEVSVTQRVGSDTAGGSSFLDVACAGSGQQIIARVSPSAGGKTFKKGPAVVFAQIFGCRGSVCGSESDSETVDVLR